MSSLTRDPCTNALKTLQELGKDPRVRLITQALGPDADLHLVGGSLRSVLLGRNSEDLDLATCLLPDEVSRQLSSSGIKIIPTGLKHQTVTAVPVSGCAGVEITTFRGPNLSPQGGISAAKTIEEDLSYRDFTINALAYSLTDNSLIDTQGGLDDISSKLVRCVGPARDRFGEDPLRVLRMVRFACIEGFSIEEQSKLAAVEFASAISKISIERVRDEITKILLSDRPSHGFSLLQELGFLTPILPEVAAFVGFEQNEFHYHDLFKHSLEVVDKTAPKLALRLAALLHDVAKPKTLTIDQQGTRHFYRHESLGAEMSRQILLRLRYSKAVIEQVAGLVRTHMRPLNAGPGGLRRLLRDTGEDFELWRELKEADATSVLIELKVVQQELACFDQAIEEIRRGPEVSPLKNLAINGNDLMAIGIKEGPEIGRLLRALHERVLDDPLLNTRETLLNLAGQLRA